MGLRDRFVDAALSRAARREERHDYRRALRAYRWADKHGRGTGLDVRMAAAGGVHRVLREMHRHGAAVTEADLDAARTAVAGWLLARARASRAVGRLAEAQRDFRAVIDERVRTLSAQAAHELAEMIDDARGNPREDRYPTTPFDRDQPRRIPPHRAVGSDSRENLRALGYATESDALATAIGLCRTVLRHAEYGLVEPRGISAFLAQLLDDYGDAAGAAAARAHQEMPSRLGTASEHSLSQAEAFAPYVIARLRTNEIVEHLERSLLRLLPPSSGLWGGYLILTDERLLFLEDFVNAPGGHCDGQMPRYEVLAVERASVTGCAFSRDEYGKTEWHFRFPATSDGRAAHQGEACVSLFGDDSDLWQATFPRC